MSKRPKFYHKFPIEVTVKYGVILNYFILRGIDTFFPIYLQVYEKDCITETTLELMQSSTTTPLTVTSFLKHKIK